MRQTGILDGRLSLRRYLATLADQQRFGDCHYIAAQLLV
jgi:hypothetical protein